MQTRGDVHAKLLFDAAVSRKRRLANWSIVSKANRREPILVNPLIPSKPHVRSLKRCASEGEQLERKECARNGRVGGKSDW
jgi:hypothetical protein